MLHCTCILSFCPKWLVCASGGLGCPGRSIWFFEASNLAKITFALRDTVTVRGRKVSRKWFLTKNCSNTKHNEICLHWHKGTYGKSCFLLLMRHPKQVLVCSLRSDETRPHLVLARLSVTRETRHLQENVTLVKHSSHLPSGTRICPPQHPHARWG